MNYSTNQVRQMFVVNDASDIVSATATAKELFFVAKGADTNLRSDIIELSNIVYAEKAAAADFATSYYSKTIALNANVNSGNPVPGQEYILRVVLRNAQSLDDGSVDFKYGYYKATTTSTAQDVYDGLANSLRANIAKEPSTLFTVASSANGVTVTEAAQKWVLGLAPQRVVSFELQGSEIYYNGDYVNWAGTVTTASAGTLPEGELVADLEYFCAGEKGDQYRMVGYPNYIPTKYLVDPTATYDVYTIHYYFEGDNGQKSLKDCIIAVKTGVTLNTTITGAVTFV